MAMEQRGQSGAYMYYASRDPMTGKVRKQYLGRGPDADKAAAALTRRRKHREDERRIYETALAELRVIDDLMYKLNDAATTLLEAVLLAAGFHRQNHEKWRKRRTRSGQ